MTAPQEPLVTHLKRAGEQVLGAKPLTGNDHVRLSALLKVAALEIEALCAARDDAAELRAALIEWARADRAASEAHKAWLSEAAKGGASYTGAKALSAGQRRWAESLPSYHAYRKASSERAAAKEYVGVLARAALAATEGSE